MAFTDNVILECGNCGWESYHDSGYPFHVDCPKCGKRMIVELRVGPSKSNRKRVERTIYTNGCRVVGSYF
jgi:DNA-directed RNA polymerase subunit RPC12/RpoP